ncbi:MAG TPA: thioredoxin-dependent thiol peroxidase [Bacteroidales bacterium]|nr:thioredoxin-dependent thiol peroxidase [Bacteroidales bacterium]
MITLKKGDPAPEFSGIDQDGNSISLSRFSGKKVVLYFYPKDSTPGCTAEACNLRDNYKQLIDKGFAIVGVSADSEKSHKNFISKHSLPFPLVADTDKKICMLYGVWGPKKFMGRTFDGINRTTFVISEKGLIEAVFTKVNTNDHTRQILDELKIK